MEREQFVVTESLRTKREREAGEVTLHPEREGGYPSKWATGQSIDARKDQSEKEEETKDS